MSKKGAAPGIFSNSNYKSTNTVQFRGQDKGKDQSLGANPNSTIEDEYIGNLQQQVHFMELELKILKEKVVDDEGNSGIGGLFDDEKTSHQHIDLLKTKYIAMRREFEIAKDKSNDKMIDVKGTQDIYDSQINAITSQMSSMYEKKEEYELNIKKDLYDTEKKCKDAGKVRSTLDAEVRSYDQQFQKESSERFENIMILDKGTKFGDLNQMRFTRDSKCVESFMKLKEENHQKIADARAAADADYMGRKDLQDQITKMKEHLEGIERNHVELQHHSVQIQILEASTGTLENMKQDLDKEKMDMDGANEDLEKRVKANQEIKLKQLKAKIDRDFKMSNQEVKELMLKIESQEESNNEFSIKLNTEKEKMDLLLAETVQLREQKKLAEAKLKQYKKSVEDSNLIISELSGVIETKQTDVNQTLKKVEAARSLNIKEEEKNRYLNKQSAALEAKLNFIEKNYDYSTVAKQIEIEYITSLVNSNDSINKGFSKFTEKLGVIQQEIREIETRKEQQKA